MTDEIDLEFPSPLTGLHILLVDDCRISRGLADELLRTQGAMTSTASDGAQAVAAVHDKLGQFDLVLMDVDMPVMDGIAATAMIRESYGTDVLPIVALSANGSPERRQACMAAGVSDFLEKPFNLAESMATIVGCLRSRRADGDSND